MNRAPSVTHHHHHHANHPPSPPRAARIPLAALPASLALLILTPSLHTHADPIPGVRSTGVDASGNPLPAGAPDPHWRLVQSPDPEFRGPVTFVVTPGFPIPPWLPQGPDSQWIAPRADQSSGNRPGDYRYRLTFTLADLDPATARITGRWASDNSGTAVLLNGQPTGLTHPGEFTVFSPTFTLSEGFLPDTNTLEFVVNNAGDGINPTGFRAELSGSADPLPAPNSPPVIRSHPADTTVAFKESARLQVSASGSPPLRFQWRLNGLPLPDQTAAILEVPWTTPSDAGDFDAVVSNPFGAVTSRVARLSIQLDPAAARAWESPGPSSRRSGLILSEIHHQPAHAPSGRDLRFLELHNTNPFPEDLSGASLQGDVNFTFPDGTSIPGLGYLVVAPRPQDVAAAYQISPVLGGFQSRLGPGRGLVRLHKRSGAILLQTEFSDDPAWDAASRGLGHSRVLARPSLGEADPRAWAPSTFVGGSPGAPEPTPPPDLAGVRFHEILSETTPDNPASPFIEIQNLSPLPADLSLTTLARPGGPPPFVIPQGTILPPNGLLLIDDPLATRLAPPQGGPLALYSHDQRRALDAILYPGQSPDLSSGRLPGSDNRWRTAETPTPGSPNSRPKPPEIAFSEIHFNPLSDDDDDEFIELHNRSNQPADLHGWSLEGGIGFAFSPGTVIEPGAFLVVARNAERLRQQHPDLPPHHIVGNYSGSLRNRGERITLLRPVRSLPAPSAPIRHHAVEDDVLYHPRDRDRSLAAGGGSSLERVDFDSPADEPAAWRDSDESAKAPWTTIQSSGPLTLTHPGVPAADQLQIILLGPGEVIVDDVEVLVAGSSRLLNGRFDGATNRWIFQGTHRTSRIEPTGGTDNSPALRLVAQDRGDHVANRVRTVLTAAIPTGTQTTLRARVRWISGHPEILLRLRNGGLEASGRLLVPTASGTPGQPNSRQLPTPPPIVAEVRHHPTLPAPTQRIRVVARIPDPQRTQSVTLRYRLDPSTSWTSVPMTDDGDGPDEYPGDGLFTGSIPGHPAGSMLAFHVLATSPLGSSSTFPPQASPNSRECLVRVGETPVPGAFGSYRIWMTEASRDTWARREKMSNEDIDVTFVSNTDRVIYNAGAHYSGSSYTSPIYDSPTGNLCGYDLSFPRTEPFLGSDRSTLDWPIRDDTNQRESLMFWFLEQYGLPNLHRRHVHLTVNGLRRGVIYDDVQQPDGDTVEQWYPDDDDGSLWKTDCWNEFDNSGNRIDPCILNTLERFPASGPKKVARYRWNWRPRAVQSSANDFSDLFTLVEAANAGANYVPTVEALVDMDHWMRTFAMNDLASYWDGFGNPNAKNTFLYKPSRGRWQLFSWDFDVGLGVFNDPPNAPLFEVNDPTIARMYRTPAFVRRYWAALQEALDSWFRTGPGSPIDRFLDARYAAFQAQNLPLANPSSIKSWINQRRSFLLQQLATVRSSFAITTSQGADFQSTIETITLTGSAPVGVASLRIQGRDRTVTWTSTSNWSVRLPLRPGLNTLDVVGLDRLGQPIPGATDSITVTFTGAPASPPPLHINEWLAANNGSLLNPATGDADDWFEIHNPGTAPVDLGGFSLTDRPDAPNRSIIPAGFTIPARGFLLVWADELPAASIPGGDLHANFRLSQGGESITLFDPLGRLVDSVSFGPQTPDQSQGRWPDGAPIPFLSFTQPTPGQPNTTPPTSPPDFRVAILQNPGQPFPTLAWNTTPGRSYQPEFSPNPATSPWLPLGPAITATSITASSPDPAPTDQTRFYRVRLLP